MMFSVIMPLYNKQDTVIESIQSILAQTIRDFEIIVVDDGSSDNSAARAESVSDARVSVLRKKNGGVSAARNYGVGRAKGDYICFLDADDLWLPNHLEALQELISAVPDAGLYATFFRQEGADGSVYSPDFGNKHILEFDNVFNTELEQRSVLHTNSICMQQSVFVSAGGFVEGERIGEDTSLWYRVAAFNKVAMINVVTTVYRLEYSGAISVSGSMNREWSFLHFYEDNIKNSTAIDSEKKQTIARFINRYRHSLVRHDLLDGKRKAAAEDLKKIDMSLSSKKENIITRACFVLPRCILVKLYRNRGK